ncbi:MAG: DUF2478 domain-containing protein [Geminicoccaceae bacterium]
MSRLDPSTPISAILYEDGTQVQSVLRSVCAHLAGLGVRLGGFVERMQPRPDRARCDMILECLSTGDGIGISQDRGPEARGCRLDMDALLKATTLGREALAAGCDLLVISKFGKAEAEGGGFRSLMVEALDLGIPMLVAVPLRNLAAWRDFAGDLGVDRRGSELPIDPSDVCNSLGLSPCVSAGPPRTEEITE